MDLSLKGYIKRIFFVVIIVFLRFITMPSTILGVSGLKIVVMS